MSRAIAALLRREVARELWAGQLDAADAVLVRLEALEPLALPTRGLRLEWLIRAGRHAEADALARQLLVLFPASPRIHLLAGRLAVARRDWAAAEAHLRESVALHPGNEARLLLARAVSNQGRLDDAEALLRALVDLVPRARRDLAWVHERRDDPARALAELERYLAEFPDDEPARSQKLRLEARLAPPAELVDEVDALLALDEPLSPSIAIEYVRTLFASGASAKARAYLDAHAADLAPWARARLAWDAYRAQVHDVALGLFLGVFAENRANKKFLTAAEAAARRSGRLGELVEAYDAHAPDEPALYGRAKRLRAELERAEE